MKALPARNRILFALLFAIYASGAAAAESVRWTYKEDTNANLSTIVAKIVQLTGIAVNVSDFSLEEERDLAFNHYRRYSQKAAGVPLKGMGIRLWTNTNGDLIQVEAQVDQAQTVVTSNDFRMARQASQSPAGPLNLERLLSSKQTLNLVRKNLVGADDAKLTGINWKDYWVKGRLIREVRARGKHGYHQIEILISTQKVIKKTYVSFPQSELAVKVWPIYEEYKGQILERIDAKLTGILERVAKPSADPFAPMRDRRYFYSKFDPIRGDTDQGRAEGYWSEAYLKHQAKTLTQALPLEANDFSGDGLLLQGTQATVNIHPDAYTKFSGIEFPAKFAANYLPRWVPATQEDGTSDYEIIPGAAYFGKPLMSAQEALDRPAVRDPQHNPLVYINDGFDELQVYYAINRLFEALQNKGFKDPDLSTRPFHAYLYDPDISMRNNAYYTSDTINFTTYSPEAQNYARDNTTIWHELGHGVMDRLMGDHIVLADTGGLSEGMADYVAALVVEDVAKGAVFPGDVDQRIINHTGFYLTNEVHDDGEAYGGTMKDMLDAALIKWGRDQGLAKITDLTLEAMRLTRDHPGLTADDWFSHMLFADELGRPGIREPGELKDVLINSLNSRNFAAKEEDRAKFSLVYDDTEVDAGTPGSRDNEIRVSIGENETATYELVTTLTSSKNYKFKYPVEVRVYLQTGPLQGAVHWVGEENTYVSYKIEKDGDTLSIPLTITGQCDAINREDGSCSDFAYIQIWNAGDPSPVAKKRFYLRLKTLEIN